MIFHEKKESLISMNDHFFKLVNNKLSDSIISTDSEGIVSEMNKKAIRHFGDDKFHSSQDILK